MTRGRPRRLAGPHPLPPVMRFGISAAHEVQLQHLRALRRGWHGMVSDGGNGLVVDKLVELVSELVNELVK